MMHVVKIRFEIESSFIIFPVCCHFETKHNCWKKKIFVKLIPFIYLDGFFFPESCNFTKQRNVDDAYAK